MPLINIADLISPESGLTYREKNAGKRHTIPLGALVEVNSDGDADDGIRLFVVEHGRDCDSEPLYYLSHCPYLEYLELVEKGNNPKPVLTFHDAYTKGVAKGEEIGSCTGAYIEKSLTVIRLPK